MAGLNLEKSAVYLSGMTTVSLRTLYLLGFVFLHYVNDSFSEWYLLFSRRDEDALFQGVTI
jgi:hypothetical protein